MKGIILAGGAGSRLSPATKVTCKQLLPIYDKPMIYYPLSTLMLMGIRDILIITTPKDIYRFKELLEDGSQLGINLSYKIQEKPKGLPDAFVVGKNFIKNDNVCLILGDNIIQGHGLPEKLFSAGLGNEGATIFGYRVNDPKPYGVVEFDENYNVVSLEEKPEIPKSNYAVIGIYIFDKNVSKYASSLSPSKRGETEITDLIKIYLGQKKLKVRLLGRGYTWLDTGSHDTMIEASEYVRTIEKRQGLKVAAIEEIAYDMGYITEEELRKLAEPLRASGYGEYLLDILRS